MRISKRVVDAAKPGNKPVFVWDGTLPGFGLLTLPTGTKSFVFQYRTPQGRTRRATVGKVGTLAPDQARDLAERMARRVKEGGDPLDDKRDSRNALTVSALLDLYTASAKYAEKAETTQKTGKGQIERHLKPLLGWRYVEGLGHDDIRRTFAAIRDGKTARVVKTGPRGLARVTGGEGAARYACRLLRAAFNWAKDEKLTTNDPTSGVDFGQDNEREVVLEAAEYTRLFAALATLEADLRLRPAVADAIRVIALTGARLGEIRGLRWQNVDLKQGRIVWPTKRHKTGHKTGKPRIISLPTAAQEIIARQPQGEANEYVFKPTKGQGPIAVGKPWKRIRAESGLARHVGNHGLRHSLATMLAVDGAQAAQLMTSLGHRQMSTTTRYLHFADKARAELAERAAAPALAGIAANKGAVTAAVTPISRGARDGRG
jgi:integrase